VRNKTPSKHTDQSRCESPEMYTYSFRMELTPHKLTEVVSTSAGLSPMAFSGDSGTVIA